MGLKLKRGNTSTWTSVDPVLENGEVGINTDTYDFKIGNGVDLWSVLDYYSTLAGGFTSPMTTLGDMIYQDASTATRLAGNTTTTKKFLAQTGTGSVSAAPTWAVIVAGDIPTLNQDTTGKSAKTDALNTTTSPVNVAAASAPSTGNFLRATDATHATWQNIVAGDIPTLNQDSTGKSASADGINSSTSTVNTSGQAAPSSGQFLKASSSSAAGWSGIVESDVSGLTTDLGLLAPKASPTLTGTVVVPVALGSTSPPQLSQVSSALQFAKPSAHGMSGWTFDPALVSVANQGVTLGTLMLCLIVNPGAISINTIYFWCTTGGSTLTNVGVGLWDTSGNLLQSRVNSNGATTTALSASGLITVSLASTQNISAGANVYAGIWMTGTTAAKLAAAGNLNLMNVNLSTGTPPTGNLRFANANTSLTTTAPANLTSLGNAGAAFWAAVG